MGRNIASASAAHKGVIELNVEEKTDKATHPGYVFSSQVPEISSFFSYITSSKLSNERCNLYANNNPEAPAPTHMILRCFGS